MGGVTTGNVGDHFEWQCFDPTCSTPKLVKYYYAGGQRVAMRDGSTLYFLLGDHLGSTALTANSNGTLYTEQRYHPWGGTRYNSPNTTPTSYQFTGQRNDSAIGLYFYNARYYDSALGRFIQADTIVPSPANPQSLNRYSYVLNNPLKYIDPSGHVEEDEVSDADQIVNELQDYGIDINPDWGWTYVRDDNGVILYRYWNPGSWKLVHLRSLNQTAKYASKLYKQYQAGEINSLTFLQKLVDYRSELGVPETFVDDISSIILGERGFGGVTRPPLHQNRWKPIALDDSGFRTYFQDSSNQVRHFWYYVHVSYTTKSGLITDIGNEVHECNVFPFSILNKGGGTSLDRVLGYRGRDLGLGLRRGTVTPIEVYGWLMRHLGAHP